MAWYQDGQLSVNGSYVEFLGKATPKKKPANHRIGPKFLYGIDPAEFDGLPVRVTFENGGIKTLERRDQPGAPETDSPRPAIATPATVAIKGPAEIVGPKVVTSHQSPVERPATTRPVRQLANAKSTPIPGAGPSFVPAYNFIPLIDRSTLPPELIDANPATHGRDLPDRYTGTIAVTITTRTPLLLPDHSKAEPIKVRGKSASVLPTMTDDDDKPILNGSAIKGMLRTAFEAITGSRLGIFGGYQQHNKPLAVRSKAEASEKSADSTPEAKYHPAVVTHKDGAQRRLTVLEHLGVDGIDLPRLQPRLNQIWVPRRLTLPDSVRDARLGSPEVDAWIQLFRHRQKGFYFWRAVKVDAAGSVELANSRPGPSKSNGSHEALRTMTLVRGNLHWTDGPFPVKNWPDGPFGPRTHPKHDERLVVTDVLEGGDPVDFVVHRGVLLDDGALTEWDGVINSYRTVRGRGDQADAMGDYARTKNGGDSERWLGMPVGRTLHVGLRFTDDSSQQFADDPPRPIAHSPRPVLIGRDPFGSSPRSLLDLGDDERNVGHLPATSITKLSPAERVFGWTPQRTAVANTQDRWSPAHRSHIRIDAAHGDKSPTGFTRPVALATLNGPKPAQYRFYLRRGNGSTINGSKTDDFRSKKGYLADQQIAGRKIYLFDYRTLDSAAYWSPQPLDLNSGQYTNEYPRSGSPHRQAVSIDGVDRYREYLAPRLFKAQTVTYIKNWVPIGCKFKITVHIDNLTATELGALLWLLSLPTSGDTSSGPDRPGHLRLGLGKPLGFGVVRAEYQETGTLVARGSAIAQSYRTIGADPTTLSPDDLRKLRDDYDSLMREHSELRFVRQAFLAAAWGEWDRPVHSPRAQERPETESFRWWVANELRNDDVTGRRVGLPLLWSKDRSLPYDPTEPAPPAGQGQSRGTGSTGRQARRR